MDLRIPASVIVGVLVIGMLPARVAADNSKPVALRVETSVRIPFSTFKRMDGNPTVLRQAAPASPGAQAPAAGGGISKAAKIGLALGAIGGGLAVGFAAAKGPAPRRWP